MKIRKAVITAGGMGTRVLPASKAVPKEMLPIVDKPAIQYIAEECVKAGITDILIILSRGKQVIEDHFDRSPDLEKKLRESGKTDVLNEILEISGMADFTYVRQQEQLGLGHAVLCARSFVGEEPFAVLYGDDVIIGEDPAIAQLCRAYGKYGKGVVGIKEVSGEDIRKYATMKLSPIGDGYFNITDMIEKPKPEQVFSRYSTMGRCVLPPDIFEILEAIPKGANNELQLTDAMGVLARREGIIGVDFTGKRYDMGSRIGILKAAIDVGLSRPDLRDELADYIKKTASEL